jgi:membrane peptidoglycan carboxypeptidase
VSNQDWPGPHWQQNDDAGRRSRHGAQAQDQTPWDDAGFWRSDDDKSRSGADRGRRSGRPGEGTGRGGGNGAGRFSQTADDLKNRLGLRGSVAGRGRSRADDDGGDADFWGEPDRGRADRSGRDSGRGGRGPSTGSRRGSNGYGADDYAGNGRAANGRAGTNGHGQTGRATANGGSVNGGSANGHSDRNGWDGAQTQGWQETGSGRGGYRGTRRATGGGAANGGAANGGAANGGAANGGAANGGAPNGHGTYDENGTGQWSARTALRERTARIGEGVRTRTTQRKGAGRGGRGDDWDGPGNGAGGGNRRFDGNGRPLTRMERFKRYVRSGDWWRHWTWKKALGLLGGGIAGLFLLGAIGLFVIYEMTPVPTDREMTADSQSSTVYFSNGKQLGVFDDEVDGVNVDRQLLNPNQIPTVMTQAMTAAEDRGFYTEGGISVTGLLRAAYDDVFGHGNLQGGSTITMQYAKNYYTGVDTGQNMSTKIKEIFIAMKLAHRENKQWIMTQYLNTVPFGPTTYGVGAAAESYFNVNLADGGKLSVAQAAMLAAMPNAPGVFNPQPGTTGYAPLVARWHYVLTNMVRDGNITQAEASAQVFPKYTPPAGGNGWTGYSGYLMQMVEQEMLAPKSMGGLGLTQQQIDTRGYHIVTTFSPSKMAALARSVNAEKAVMKQQAADGSGRSLPDYDHIGAALIDPKTGAITAIYGGPGYLSSNAECLRVDCQINTAEVPEEVGSSFKPYVLSAAVDDDMNVFTSILDGYGYIFIPYSPADVTPTELALSVLKPLPGATVDTNSTGTVIGFTMPNGMRYYHFPEGADDPSVDKPLPVSVAAATSSDPAFEDLAHRDGITNVIKMAKAMGVGSNPFLFPTACHTGLGWSYAQTLAACNDFDGQNGIQTQFSPTLASKYYEGQGLPGSPQIALGEAPLTAIEQASTFATLADDGVYHTPHVIAQLNLNGTPVNMQVTTRRVLSPDAAGDVSWALSFDNEGAGTAAATVSYHPGGIIAKTGTIGSGATSAQAWFVGAVPYQEAMAVTLYANDPGLTSEALDNLPITPSGESGSLGGGWPASIWNNFFTTDYSNLPDQSVQSAMPTLNGYPFQTWIQAKAIAPKLQTCKPGQFKNCKPATCKPGLRFVQGCTGGNPSPNPSCQPFTGQCNPSPNPSGNPSPNPSSSVSPSPTTSCTPAFPGGQCTTPPGTTGQAKTTAAIRAVPAAPPFVGAEDKWALLAASLAVTGIAT